MINTAQMEGTLGMHCLKLGYVYC